MATSHQRQRYYITKVGSQDSRDVKYIDICHRGPGGASRQAAFLRREGVSVVTGQLGELTVNLEIYGWFPDFLPSQEAEAEAEANESEEEEGSG